MSVLRRCLIIIVALGIAACSSPAPSTTTTGQPSSTTTTAPSTTTTTAPSAHVVVYLLMDDTGNPGRPGPFLVPVERTASNDDLSSALMALLAGPTTDETQMIPAMSTAIPGGTQIKSIDDSEGVAIVNLSEAFESGGGSFSTMARLAQVVYTATRFDAVDSVLFELDGEPVSTFSTEGIELDGPQTRDDYLDFLPMIFVDDPAYGGTLDNPAHLSGVAAVFEAVFQAAVVDRDGLILAEPPYLTTTNGTGWGTFDVTIEYEVDEPQWGSLIVWENSAKDGSQINVREYRVWLTPAG
jgi:germination protein M